ncbi:hypothetical protein ACFQ1Q_12750 [Winogradskyella litorisediminis]|uniref:TonB-like protein n=1 Tax=Winogradskyella litorisediminis TaxID=1156618 RepID=A0ABW3N8Y3_9FLAO
MKNNIILLSFISVFAFGQKKVKIDENVLKYEIKDDFNRFDDVSNSENDYERLSINFKNSELEIKNSQSSKFTGDDISFIINNKLELKSVSYDYWTDYIDFKNIRTYKVKSSKLILNQNPFFKSNGLRGKYILEIEHYWNDTLTKTTKFKGKFKSFKGINKTSADYLWVMQQNKMGDAILNEDGIYLRPDKMASLKSNIKDLTKKIKEIKVNKPNRLKAYLVIDENGKVEKESITFLEYIDKEFKMQVTELLFEFTEWYPACVNEEEVKSRIPIIIKID